MAFQKWDVNLTVERLEDHVCSAEGAAGSDEGRT